MQLPGVVTDFAVHHGDFAVEILIQQNDVGGISGFDLSDALESQSVGGRKGTGFDQLFEGASG